MVNCTSLKTEIQSEAIEIQIYWQKNKYFSFFSIKLVSSFSFKLQTTPKALIKKYIENL